MRSTPSPKLEGKSSCERQFPSSRALESPSTRCRDPTELGTFTNGIYCAKCPSRKGILLPENPLEDESNWICNNCLDEKPAAFVTKLLDEDGIRLVHRTDVNVADLEAYILKWGQILYQNHFFLTAAKMHLRLALGFASVTTAFSTADTSRMELKRASGKQ